VLEIVTSIYMVFPFDLFVRAIFIGNTKHAVNYKYPIDVHFLSH
jgi:hypothetical protein